MELSLLVSVPLLGIIEISQSNPLQRSVMLPYTKKLEEVMIRRKGNKQPNKALHRPCNSTKMLRR